MTNAKQYDCPLKRIEIGRMPRTCTISDMIHVFSFCNNDDDNDQSNLTSVRKHFSMFINRIVFKSIQFFRLIRSCGFSPRPFTNGKMTSHANAWHEFDQSYELPVLYLVSARRFAYNNKKCFLQSLNFVFVLYAHVIFWVGAAILSARSNQLQCIRIVIVLNNVFNWFYLTQWHIN